MMICDAQKCCLPCPPEPGAQEESLCGLSWGLSCCIGRAGCDAVSLCRSGMAVAQGSQSTARVPGLLVVWLLCQVGWVQGACPAAALLVCGEGGAWCTCPVWLCHGCCVGWVGHGGCLPCQQVRGRHQKWLPPALSTASQNEIAKMVPTSAFIPGGSHFSFLPL